MKVKFKRLPGLFLLVLAPSINSTAQDEQYEERAPSGLPVAAPVNELILTGKGYVNDAAVFDDQAEPGSLGIFTTSYFGNIAYHSTNGGSLEKNPAVPASFIALIRNFLSHNNRIDVMVAADNQSGHLRLSKVERQIGSVQLTPINKYSLSSEITGLCIYESRVTGDVFAFAVTQVGDLQQWWIYSDEEEVVARQVRRIPVGFGASNCVADTASNSVFVLESRTGIWRIDAEPETDPVNIPFGLFPPYGDLREPVNDMVIISDDAARRFMVLFSNEDSLLGFYRLSDAVHAGDVQIQSKSGKSDSVRLGIVKSSVAPLSGGNSRWVVASGHDTTNGRSKMLFYDRKELVSKLPKGSAQFSQPGAEEESLRPIVIPTSETQPVKTTGDSADDPAIWIHPSRPELSLFIATEKKAGMNVYDLSGRLIQELPDGRINNVDLRYGFPLGDREIDIVAASNRSTNSIGIYRVDPATRRLNSISEAEFPAELAEPYGLCMSRDPRTSRYYVFVTDTDTTLIQYRLEAETPQSVAAREVRRISLQSKAEGCVVDDKLGYLYVGEEKAGIRRFDADPSAKADNVLIDSIENEPLTADIEGISLYVQETGEGYLIASSQGSNSYSVYHRNPPNGFLGSFIIASNSRRDIDGASQTDGLAVTGLDAGPMYPEGLLVVQDGRNVAPAENQNFKLVDWRSIAATIKLNRTRPLQDFTCGCDR